MPLSKFMKNPFAAVLFATSVFTAGCSSLDNPFSGLFRTGHDARVYNAQTGDFEWPEDSSKPRAPRKAAGAAPAPERKGDGRYFDAAKNQWVEAPLEGTAASRSKARPAAPAVVAAPGPQSVVAPPAPPPARASGVYNPSTGQIEWGAYAPAPASAAQPTQRKNWWWPF